MSATLDPRGHDSELEQALCVLAAQPRSKNGWLTATDISRILRHDFGMGVHWRTVATCLDKSKDCVTRRKRNRRWWYQILDKGNELVTKPRSSVTLVDPAKAVENLTTLHDLLSGLSGCVRVCDPYLDPTTLEHLDSCPPGSTIQLLTYNIKDSGRLRQTVVALLKTAKTIEIRRASEPVIHDRYMIDDKTMLILGTSLNGFGKKQCFLIRAGKDIRYTMLSSFNDHWREATPWP